MSVPGFLMLFFSRCASADCTVLYYEYMYTHYAVTVRYTVGGVGQFIFCYSSSYLPCHGIPNEVCNFKVYNYKIYT